MTQQPAQDPDPGAARDELLAGFAPGGAWDACAPGPELAAALAAAAGPEWRCPGASGGQLTAILRGFAAVESWAAAGRLGAIRALIRDDDIPYRGQPRHRDLPDTWDDSLAHETALALAASAPSADKTMRAAWELGARLPGTDALLKAGVLDAPKARLVTEVFGGLSDENAARAEELLLPELTEPPRKTYAQVERAATAIALQVDPHLAERNRKAAEKHAARVQMFRERAGTAALSGRDLPTDETLAANAKINARARHYKDSGAFPDARMDRLRAAAYLDLLNNVTPAERIAHGLDDDQPRASEDPGTSASPDTGRAPGGGAPTGPVPGPAGGPWPGGSDCPCRECNGRCQPGDDGPDGDGGDPDGDGPEDDTPDEGGPDDGPGGGPNDRPEVDDPHSDHPGDRDNPDADNPDADNPDADGPDAGDLPDGGPSGAGSERPSSSDGTTPGACPVLQDLIFPLTTLLGLADRPGEGHGLGAFDPALCRALAAIAARSPHTAICLTVTDPDGTAIGHGCAKPDRAADLPSDRPANPPPGGPAPPLVELPARLNLTITADRLAELARTPGPPGAKAPTGWALTPHASEIPGARTTAYRKGAPLHPDDPDWCGTRGLTLPSGCRLTVTLEPVPTRACDHRNESHAYEPNDKLRHLVQVRDHTCTFPTCNRHARESDFEHAVPYDKGGRTCACNAGARSRRCHRVKQSPGWKVTQPKPGWHQWTTPRGRTYTQRPKRYPGLSS